MSDHPLPDHLHLHRVTAASTPRVVTSGQGPQVDLGALSVRFLIWSEETGGGFSLVEHPIPPRTLAAPLHRHSREDEYSVVLEGQLAVLLENEVILAKPGDVVFKPRDQWHTFWNPGDDECRLLEIISPGGFERMFWELGRDTDAFVGETAADLDARYGLEVDYDSIDRLCHEHGLVFPAE